jgi:hypothetical protein
VLAKDILHSSYLSGFSWAMFHMSVPHSPRVDRDEA